MENDDRASVLVVEPTVMASVVRAGEVLQAFAPLPLPAASAYVTPEAIELRTALSSEVFAPPPRLMFATAGLIAFAVTQSTPRSRRRWCHCRSS